MWIEIVSGGKDSSVMLSLPSGEVWIEIFKDPCERTFAFASLPSGEVWIEIPQGYI